MCEECNLQLKVSRLRKLREKVDEDVNRAGSYPMRFPVEGAEQWHHLYWIVHSELRKIQRFNNDVESLNVFEPAAPTWSSCIDEIYALTQKSESLSLEQLKGLLHIQRLHLMQTDMQAYNKLMSCISKVQRASPGELVQVLRYLKQIIFSKMKTLLLGLLQHEVAFRVRTALPGRPKLADTVLQWFIFRERKVLQRLLLLYLHSKHDPVGFSLWLRSFGSSAQEVAQTLDAVSRRYDLFTYVERPGQHGQGGGQHDPSSGATTAASALRRDPMMTSQKVRHEVQRRAQHMGDNLNGDSGLLTVLFALMRDRVREGSAGRKIHNLSNFLKGFLLAANGADLDEGESQRQKVQFHDMKQYTSVADSSLLFYTRCAIAVYGPLLLNNVFYKNYPPANFAAAKGKGSDVQYDLVFRHTGIHRHQIINVQWATYDFNPPHFVVRARARARVRAWRVGVVWAWCGAAVSWGGHGAGGAVGQADGQTGGQAWWVCVWGVLIRVWA